MRKKDMRRVCSRLGAGALATLCGGVVAHASSHREAPLITEMPKVDGTDLYMFRSYEPGRENFVTLIADYQPFQDPFGGPNYFTLDPDAVYDIHVENTGDAVEDITFRFRFKNEAKNIALNVGGSNVAVPVINVGPIGVAGNSNDTANLNVEESYTIEVIRGPRNSGNGQPIANAATGETTFKKPVDNIGQKTLPDYAAYAAAHIYDVNIPGCDMPGRVFVGQRKDPFVVSVGEIFDLVNIAVPIGAESSEADNLANKNVTALALEIPTSCLVGDDPVIGAWTSASVPSGKAMGTGNSSKSNANENARARANANSANGLVQVSRLGHPLVNELVIGLPDKDKFNASEPKDDAQFANYVTNPTLPAILETLFSSAGVVAPTLFPRADLVATFLTGIEGINQRANAKTVTPAEFTRLNTSVLPQPAESQNRLGVIGGDAAGFPNGRRPGDDVVDIELRVVMGRLIALGLFGNPSQAPSGMLDFTDGAFTDASHYDQTFPYLRTPLPGSPTPADSAQEAAPSTAQAK